MVNAGRDIFFLRPLAQSSPAAHEAFMREIDDGTRVQRCVGRWRQEGASRTTEDVDDLDHLRFRNLADGSDLLNRCRSPHAAVVRKCVRQGFEHPLCDVPAEARSSLLVGLFGVQRQGLPQGSDGFVVTDVDWFATFPMLFPIVPCAHQGVLQQRKSVLVNPKIVEQSQNKARSYFSASYPDRTGDRQTKFGSRHTRNEVLAR